MATKKSTAEKLADLIEMHPECDFQIDNDCWYMVDPNRAGDDGEDIANSNSHNWSTDWYGDGSNYGAAIAEAMVILLNRRGFKITAGAV